MSNGFANGGFVLDERERSPSARASMRTRDESSNSLDSPLPSNNNTVHAGGSVSRGGVIETSFIQYVDDYEHRKRTKKILQNFVFFRRTFEGMENSDTLNSSESISIKDLDDTKVSANFECKREGNWLREKNFEFCLNKKQFLL